MYPAKRHLELFSYIDIQSTNVLIAPMCEIPHLCPSCYLEFRNKTHKLFMNIRLHGFSALRSRSLMGFPKLQEMFTSCY